MRTITSGFALGGTVAAAIALLAVPEETEFATAGDPCIEVTQQSLRR